MCPTNLPTHAKSLAHQYGALATPNVPVLFTQTVSLWESALQHMYGQSSSLTFKRWAALMSAETQKHAYFVSTASLTTDATSAGPGHCNWSWYLMEWLTITECVASWSPIGLCYGCHWSHSQPVPILLLQHAKLGRKHPTQGFFLPKFLNQLIAGDLGWRVVFSDWVEICRVKFPMFNLLRENLRWPRQGYVHSKVDASCKRFCIVHQATEVRILKHL